jgi:hypothetical protein
LLCLYEVSGILVACISQLSTKDLTFQTKISDSIWREHKNTVGISDFVRQ